MRTIVAMVVLAGCARATVTAPAPSEKPTPDALNAAVWLADHERVRTLLAGGVAADAPGNEDRTPWFWAVTMNDRPLTELLLGQVRSLPTSHLTLRALAIAAARDDRWLVSALLTRGMTPDGEDDGRASALLVAAANAHADMVALLLDAGADASRADADGDTPLRAATRAGCTRCAELLRAHGARDDAPDPATAAVAVPSPGLAVARSIPLLQAEAAHWTDEPGCGSCHHQAMAVQVTASAERHGIAFDAVLARTLADWFVEDDKNYGDLIERSLATPESTVALSMENTGDVAFGVCWFSTAMADSRTDTQRIDTLSAALVARIQRADGHWSPGPARGVMEGSAIASTAMCLRTLTTYGTAAMRAHVERAGRWLRSARPTTTTDHVYRMRGLAWLGGASDEVARERDAILRLQRPDGSWSDDALPGDAYMTGLVLIALVRDGGVTKTAPAIARGVEYLLRTQAADGSWRVHTRAAPFQPPMNVGFPYGKHQVISYAGTAYATLALLEML